MGRLGGQESTTRSQKAGPLPWCWRCGRLQASASRMRSNCVIIQLPRRNRRPHTGQATPPVELVTGFMCKCLHVCGLRWRSPQRAEPPPNHYQSVPERVLRRRARAPESNTPPTRAASATSSLYHSTRLPRWPTARCSTACNQKDAHRSLTFLAPTSRPLGNRLPMLPRSTSPRTDIQLAFDGSNHRPSLVDGATVQLRWARSGLRAYAHPSIMPSHRLHQVRQTTARHFFQWPTSQPAAQEHAHQARCHRPCSPHATAAVAAARTAQHHAAHGSVRHPAPISSSRESQRPRIPTPAQIYNKGRWIAG